MFSVSGSWRTFHKLQLRKFSRFRKTNSDFSERQTPTNFHFKTPPKKHWSRVHVQTNKVELLNQAIPNAENLVCPLRAFIASRRSLNFYFFFLYHKCRTDASHSKIRVQDNWTTKIETKEDTPTPKPTPKPTPTRPRPRPRVLATTCQSKLKGKRLKNLLSSPLSVACQDKL